MNFHHFYKLINCAAAGQYINQTSIITEILPHIYLVMAKVKYKS